MALTSRLEVEIDSRDSEQKSKDLRAALVELEASGNLINPSLKKASQGMDGLGKSAKAATASTKDQREELEALLGRLDPIRKKQDELAKSQAKLAEAFKAGDLNEAGYERFSGIIRDQAVAINSSRGALTSFNTDLGKTGMSAKATSAAMRGVPAQITDIVTSLQGGQAPLTVFLQQGGQLKDMFGGVGPAAKALGSSLLGLVNPFTVTAAAAAALGYVFYDSERQASAFNKALFSGTASSGQTASSLAAISKSASTLTGNISSANDSVIALASSSRLSQTQFVNLAQAASSIGEFSGKGAGDVAKSLGDMGDNATKAAEKISSQYGLLTSAQYDVIAGLDEQGKKQEALDALSASLNDNAQKRLVQYRNSLSDLERDWNDVGTAISNAYSRVKAGLFPGIDEQIARARNDLDEANKGNVGLFQNKKEMVEFYTDRLNFLEDEKAAKEDIAKFDSDNQKADQARIEAGSKWNTLSKKELSDQAKLLDDIKDARLLGVEAGKSQAEIDKVVADIQAKYDKSQAKPKAYTEDAGTKALDQAKQQYAVLMEQSSLIDQQGVGTKALGAAAKDLIEWEQQLANIKTKQTLTADQQSLLAKADQITAVKTQSAEQEKLNALKKEELETSAKLLAFQESINNQLDLSQEGLSNQLAGVGMGREAQKRLQDDLKIRQDYQKQLAKLQRDYQNIVNPTLAQTDLYDKETQVLEDALGQRLRMQQDYYVALDRAQSDWTNGANAAWQDYVYEAGDIAGQTYDLFDNAFHGMEDSLVDFVTGGKLSFKDLADSIIADIARIIIKTQVVTPLLNSLFGGGAGAGGGGGIASLFSGSSSNGSGGGGLFSGLAGLGQNLLSAWNTITGVGSSVASGYASGGIGGAISGGASYYGNMLSNIASTLSGGFTSLIGGNIAITGATAAGTAATTAALTGVTAAQAAAAAATVGAEGITAAALQGAIAEGAASIGTNIGVAGATTAAASQGIAASISGALSSAAAMWPLAVIMGMYQSGKLYDAGVRPSMSEMQATGGDTALGKATMAPIALQSGIMELTDKINSKLVGGKLAAIISGSTLHQAVWGAVGKKLFGGAWETKDGGISLGVEDGEFDAQQYIYQKKKGGLFSSSKKRTRYSALDAETEDALGSAYNEKILNSMGLFSALGVQLSETVLDGLNVAASKISTKGKTAEAVQEELDKWFAGLGDSAVSAINTATGSGLQDYNFEALTTFVNNLYSVNATVKMLGIKALDMSVSGGRAVETMISLSGTIDTLNTGLSTYYDGFTTDIEKTANSLSAARSAFTQFGFTLPDTRDGLKAVVQALDLTTDVGQNMLVAITKNADAATAAYAILEARESAYRSAFFSEAENTALAIKGTTAELKALGVTLPASRSEYRKMVEEAAKSTTDTGKAMYDTLMNAAAAASTVFDELERRLNQGVTDSFSGVQRSITAQQKAATAAYNATNTSLSDMSATASKAVTDLSTVSNSLESALKSLNGTSDDAVKTLRAQAQATLQSALATARAGGSLSGFTGLSDALDTVGNNSTDLYSSMEDFARDQGRTAGVVAELEAINGKQLTSAELTVKALEDQLDTSKEAYELQMAQFDQDLAFAQAQMDAFNGIDTSVKSVEAAIKALNGSLIASLAAKPATGAGSASSNTPANNGTVVDTLYQQLFGRTAGADENKYWADRLSSGNLAYSEIVGNMTQYASAADKARMAALAVKGHATGGYISGPGTGTSDSILARLSNGEYVMTADSVRMFGTGMLDQMNAGNLPAFAGGGGIRLVGSSTAESSRPASARYGSGAAAAAMSGSGSQQGVIEAILSLGNYLYMITKYSEQTASGIRRQNEMEEAA